MDVLEEAKTAAADLGTDWNLCPVKTIAGIDMNRIRDEADVRKERDVWVRFCGLEPTSSGTGAMRINPLGYGCSGRKRTNKVAGVVETELKRSSVLVRLRIKDMRYACAYGAQTHSS